jgi:hypothetical protein
MFRFALLFLLMTVPSGLAAQRPEIPAPVQRGLELLQVDSAEAAVAIWSAAWTNSTDAGKAAAILAGFRQLAQLGGRVRAYDILGVESVGPHIRRVFVLLRYERLPVFAQLVAYDRGLDTPSWMVATVSLNTDPHEVLPASYWPR